MPHTLLVTALVVATTTVDEHSPFEHLLTSSNFTFTVETAGSQPHHREHHGIVGYFLRNFNSTQFSISLDLEVAAALDGLTHYRLIPGQFPEGMDYHFDGLATVLKMSVTRGHLSVESRGFESRAFKSWDSCLFFGTGTGPTRGRRVCFQNPGVNLLPLGSGEDAQLWLTIDTSSWGRVDPDSLATVDGARVEVGGAFTLNAHPACDPHTFECFVQHPCPSTLDPISGDICISQLIPSTHVGSPQMRTARRSRAVLPRPKLIQHSHSPCLTPRFVVSKIDAFQPRDSHNANHGLLHQLEQAEGDLWMVMERSTNRSTVVVSEGHQFVNNHFWNCFEDPASGDVIIEAVPATSSYLDTYFAASLAQPLTPWATLLTAPLLCRLPASVLDARRANNVTIRCEPMFGDESSLVFDYPTYNPLVKMQPYRFFYAIAPSSTSARWFDELIKVDRSTTPAVVVRRWSSSGIFLTEADFVPLEAAVGGSMAAEDDGRLITILYNSTSDESLFGVFDARTLQPQGIYPLRGLVVPFHAHGIVCPKGSGCFTNP